MLVFLCFIWNLCRLLQHSNTIEVAEVYLQAPAPGRQSHLNSWLKHCPSFQIFRSVVTEDVNTITWTCYLQVSYVIKRKTGTQGDQLVWINTKSSMAKHQSVTSQAISTGQGWRFLNQLFQDLDSSNIEALGYHKMQTNHQKVRLKICKKLQRWATKVLEVLWTDETKVNLHQSHGKAKVWRKKESSHDLKHTSSFGKHMEEVSWLGHAWLLLE